MRILVVGYGFAGASIAHFLRLLDADVSVINHSEYDLRSSTNVSAGLIVPLSGRRKAPVFCGAETIPYAWKHYSELQNKSSLNIISDYNVIELIHDFREYNDWYGKSSDNKSSEWFEIESNGINPFIKSTGHGYIKYNNAGCISPLNLIKAYKQLNNQIKYIDENLDYQLIEISNDAVVYEMEKYDLVVFAEGHRCTTNPFWSYLPFMPVKGEIIDFYSTELDLNFIINGDLYVIPMGNGFYRAGATYSWDDIDEFPSNEGLAQLKDKLDKLICCNYEVVKHLAAIRPAIKDRRPVIGQHPEFENIWIFNGLGTKGALYSPYFGKQLAEAIVQGKPLDKEVDVSRFAFYRV
ncbi:MAG: NAD(P)/FAD-dependent oxidoreductase [Bacteroidota bacterium]